MNQQSSARLHADSIVIDAVCPLARPGSEYLEWYRAGGVTALAPSVETDDIAATLNDLGLWHRLFREREDLLLVRRAADIEAAKQTGRLGIYLHFQGADPIGTNLDLVDFYKALGVGIVQLTYNVKNRVGDGCEERTDAGLSRFGVKLIERLNKARVLVDCSHTGLRTSLDAIECSTAPVVLSHTNAASVHASPRNAPASSPDGRSIHIFIPPPGSVQRQSARCFWHACSSVRSFSRPAAIATASCFASRPDSANRSRNACDS